MKIRTTHPRKSDKTQILKITNKIMCLYLLWGTWSACDQRASNAPEHNLLQPTQLPIDTTHGECNEPSLPTVCEWAQNSDVIFLGRLISLQKHPDNLFKIDKQVKDRSWCAEGSEYDALQMEVEPIHWLKGKQNVSHGILKISIGSELVIRWGTPRFDQYGVVQNFVGDNYTNEASILQPNTWIGVAASQIQSEHGDFLTLGGEFPFTMDENENVVFANYELCYPFPAPSFRGMLDTLTQEIFRCPEDELIQEQRTAFWRSNPAWMFAGLCNAQDPEETTPRSQE